VNGRTPGVVFSVAHLEGEERNLVLGLLFDEVLSWVRSLQGTQRLRALIVIDEAFGLLPPHPANPATKAPIVALMKQARAYGVGILVATQNPMDLDYRALSNAGLWCIGRLQTDADRARVIDGLSLAASSTISPKSLNETVKKLHKRWFLVSNAHDDSGPKLLQPRWAYSFMRGPMTRAEIRRVVGMLADSPVP
jgi:DNA helicase HerA-like ATPase